MMWLPSLLLILAGLASAKPTAATHDSVERRQAITTGSYCSPITNLCYVEYGTQADSVFRIAVPDSANQASGFDIAVQIVGPVSQGWAGLSWGGGMTGSPLTVAWQNGNDAVVSSRWSDVYQMPTVYSSATYTLLADTGVNGTHFTLSAICKGCSTWTRTDGSTRALSPTGGVTLAWAGNREPGGVAQRSDPGSSFSYHSYQGRIDASFREATVPAAEFEAAAAMAKT